MMPLERTHWPNSECLPGRLEDQKKQALADAFVFQTTFSTPKRLICNNHENKYFISILPRHQNRADRFSL